MNNSLARRSWFHALTGLALLGLAGCDSIGDGSTMVSLQIETVSGETTEPFMLHRCLRDQLIAVATFTDGTRANYSGRVTWATSDPAVVRVSNSDLTTVTIDEGAFTDANFNYVGGVLEPAAASGTATVSASFLGFTSTRQVQLYTPTLRIAPIGQGVDPQVQPPAARHLLPTTLLRYGFFILDHEGRTVTGSSLNANGLNPILWRFPSGVFEAADPDVAVDFDKYVVPDATTRTAYLNPINGTVTGVTVEDGATYTLEAVTSLCEGDPTFTPTAQVGVAGFATANPLELKHEEDFNGPGATPTGDLVGGTTEVLQVIANLDADGDGAADTTQDISSQVQFDVDSTTTCGSAAETNCTCDTAGCFKRLLATTSNTLVSLSTTDFSDATVAACFSTEDASHFDDCAETAPAPVLSNVLSVRSVPVDLTGANATLTIDPLPAPERAFTYPGRQLDVYGTFTATTAQLFAGASTTGTQKINRFVFWTARPEGWTTEVSEVGFVTLGDSNFAPIGSFIYLNDVAQNTVLDLYLTTVSPLNEIDPPTAPVQFTVCPSDAATCP